MSHDKKTCSCHGTAGQPAAHTTGPIALSTPRPKVTLPKMIKVAKADEALYRQVIEAAKRASEDAYCPYSQYNVGAAVLTFDGEIHAGFNVENCGYSQTIHAEESALTRALGSGLLRRAAAQGVDQFHAIKAVAVYAPKGSDPWPCCNCRQFLGEFGYDMHIIGEEPKDGRILCLTLGQLVPFAFPIEEVLASVRGQR